MDNCKEAVHRLYQYLDRELSEDEQRVVQRHLSHCPPCLDLFRFEENVLTFVGDKCRETAAPANLRDRVRKLCQGSDDPAPVR
jgi:mycothiol system anti-sigma-R factor